MPRRRRAASGGFVSGWRHGDEQSVVECHRPGRRVQPADKPVPSGGHKVWVLFELHTFNARRLWLVGAATAVSLRRSVVTRAGSRMVSFALFAGSSRVRGTAAGAARHAVDACRGIGGRFLRARAGRRPSAPIFRCQSAVDGAPRKLAGMVAG